MFSFHSIQSSTVKPSETKIRQRKIIRAQSFKLKLNWSDIDPHFLPLDIIFQIDGLKVLTLLVVKRKR